MTNGNSYSTYYNLPVTQLTDTNITDPVNNNGLVYENGLWVNKPVAPRLNYNHENNTPLSTSFTQTGTRQIVASTTQKWDGGFAFYTAGVKTTEVNTSQILYSDDEGTTWNTSNISYGGSTYTNIKDIPGIPACFIDSVATAPNGNIYASIIGNFSAATDTSIVLKSTDNGGTFEFIDASILRRDNDETNAYKVQNALNLVIAQSGSQAGTIILILQNRNTTNTTELTLTSNQTTDTTWTLNGFTQVNLESGGGANPGSGETQTLTYWKYDTSVGHAISSIAYSPTLNIWVAVGGLDNVFNDSGLFAYSNDAENWVVFKYHQNRTTYTETTAPDLVDSTGSKPSSFGASFEAQAFGYARDVVWSPEAGAFIMTLAGAISGSATDEYTLAYSTDGIKFTVIPHSGSGVGTGLNSSIIGTYGAFHGLMTDGTYLYTKHKSNTYGDYLAIYRVLASGFSHASAWTLVYDYFDYYGTTSIREMFGGFLQYYPNFTTNKYQLSVLGIFTTDYNRGTAKNMVRITSTDGSSWGSETTWKNIDTAFDTNPQGYDPIRVNGGNLSSFGYSIFYLKYDDSITGGGAFSSITTSNNPKIFSLTGNFTKIIGDITVGNTGTSFIGRLKLYYHNNKEDFSNYTSLTLEDNLTIDANYHSIPINLDFAINGPLYGCIVLENPNATAGYGINNFAYSLTFI